MLMASWLLLHQVLAASQMPAALWNCHAGLFDL
jgi:hypothetical protein